jgi:hypothetical protein
MVSNCNGNRANNGPCSYCVAIHDVKVNACQGWSKREGFIAYDAAINAVDVELVGIGFANAGWFPYLSFDVNNELALRGTVTCWYTRPFRHVIPACH